MSAAKVRRERSWLAWRIGGGPAQHAHRPWAAFAVAVGCGATLGIVGADPPSRPEGTAADSSRIEAGAAAPADRARAERAAEDVSRGREILASKKGARRLKDAAAAFTAAIDALAPGAEPMDPSERATLADAYAGRAQCRVLQGKERDAEEDLARLLSVEPGYAIDAGKMPKTLVDRFRRVRDRTLAWVTLQPDPPEARLVWNGREVPPDAAPEHPVVAGPFVLAGRLACYGPVTVEGTLAAGERKVVPIHLDPVARAVRFETTPEGFDVELDGTLVGRTASPPPSPPPSADPQPSPGEGSLPTAPVAGAAASEEGSRGDENPSGSRGDAATSGKGVLEIACVTAGEHAFVLRKECYDEARGTVSVDIDFADPSPVAAPPLAPTKQEVLLTLVSDVPGARVTIDGAEVGMTPLPPRTLCPGTKAIEVRAADRLVWAAAVPLEHVGPASVVARVRPTLRIAEGHTEILEPSIKRLRHFNLAPPSPELDFALVDALQGVPPDVGTPDRVVQGGPHGIPSSAGAQDGESPGRPDARSEDESARALRTAWGADLLLTVESGSAERPGVRLRLAAAADGLTSASEETFCEPPEKDCVRTFFERLDAPWPRTEPMTGAVLAPSSGGAGPIVVASRGPAATAGLREGDRIVEAGGAKLTGLTGPGSFGEIVLGALGSEGDAAEVPIVVERAGQKREARLSARRAPVVLAPGPASVPAARILAAADLEAQVLPPGEARNAALLNLASVMISEGRPQRALDLSLERPGWAEGVPGAASRATARFLAGRCYAMLGDRARALEAFHQAAADEGATFWEPDGLPVAPLARLEVLAGASAPASATPRP